MNSTVEICSLLKENLARLRLVGCSVVMGLVPFVGSASQSQVQSAPGYKSVGVSTEPKLDCGMGDLVWRSLVDQEDIGKTGDQGLFDDWGAIRTSEFSSRNLERIYGALAPDGSIAYEVVVPVQAGINLPLIAFDQTPGYSLSHVHAEFQIWLPEGYWSGANGGQKFWGVWTEGEGVLYGTEANRQVENDASSIVVGVPNRFRTYSYYRNRPEAHGDINDPYQKYWIMDEGRWVTLGQEIKLNDPGQRNGYLRFFIDGVEVSRALTGLEWILDPVAAGVQGFGTPGWNGSKERLFASKFWLRNFVLCDLASG